MKKSIWTVIAVVTLAGCAPASNTGRFVPAESRVMASGIEVIYLDTQTGRICRGFAPQDGTKEIVACSAAPTL